MGGFLDNEGGFWTMVGVSGQWRGFSDNAIFVGVFRQWRGVSGQCGGFRTIVGVFGQSKPGAPSWLYYYLLSNAHLSDTVHSVITTGKHECDWLLMPHPITPTQSKFAIGKPVRHQWTPQWSTNVTGCWCQFNVTDESALFNFFNDTTLEADLPNKRPLSNAHISKSYNKSRLLKVS